MSEDITFCGHRNCPNITCDRNSKNIKQTWLDHSYAYFNDCEYHKTESQNFTEDNNRNASTGEWIIDGHHRRCNYCNEYTCIEDREGNSISDNFCPKGGAE